MKIVVKRIIILTLGWLFLILGVIGLFLPILQGFLFIGIGLAVLSKESETAKRILLWVKKRYPQAYQQLVHFRTRFSRILKKKSSSHDGT